MTYAPRDVERIRRQRSVLVGMIALLPRPLRGPSLKFLAILEARHVSPEDEEEVLGRPEDG